MIEVNKVYRYVNPDSSKNGRLFKVTDMETGPVGLAFGRFLQPCDERFGSSHSYILTSYLNELAIDGTLINECAELPPVINDSICCDSPNIIKNHVMVMGEPLTFRVCRNCKEEIV